MLSICLSVFQPFWIPLLKVLILGLYSIFVIGLFVLLSSLYILETSHLSDVGLVNIFSHSIGCHFVMLTTSFALQKLFSFRRSHLPIVSLRVCVAGVIFRKWSPVPMSSSILPTFSSIKFSMAAFMLRSLIHLDLSFMHSDRYGSIFRHLHVDI